jgi:hypothetical protein
VPITGRCHCGAIAFELDWPDAGPIPARACDCAFCLQHGAAWASHPAACLRLSLPRAEFLSRYRFGTHTADFLVCARCGGVPACLSRIDGRDYAVVNVNAFCADDAARVHRLPLHLDEETPERRLARRRERWIGAVATTAPAPA